RAFHVTGVQTCALPISVMRLAVTSETMNVQDLSVFVEDEIVDRLSSVPGVATVQVYGNRNKIFRVDIDPARLASLGLTIGDIGRSEERRVGKESRARAA